ncbi:MAG: FAD:protein FMN transferase [Deltaproteobacteria bacterium]|nr:FAD:protein FMN transferase [Deltaproteobacteria bacterium]
MVFCLAGCSKPGDGNPVHEIAGTTMGTYFSVKIVTASSGLSPEGYRKIARGIEQRLAEINSQMSVHVETSELSRFNRYQGSEWFPVSDNLAAIAKGFGVDAVSAYLEAHAILDYLVDIGGEVRAGGRNHLEKPWRVGIVSPDRALGVQKIVALSGDSGRAMATSGDYHNYFEVDGRRYSHTIDPKTGKPVTHALASVSVIHRECALADAYATAISAMGPGKGLQWAKAEQLPVLMIIRTAAGLVEKNTAEFNSL